MRSQLYSSSFLLAASYGMRESQRRGRGGGRIVIERAYRDTSTSLVVSRHALPRSPISYVNAFTQSLAIPLVDRGGPLDRVKSPYCTFGFCLP